MFESHITVESFPAEDFKKLCKDLGSKPLVIRDPAGDQMMTAKFHKTDDRSVAYGEMMELAKSFGSHVIRRKLELIVGKDHETPKDILYPEFHSQYIVPTDKIELFKSLVKDNGGYSSENMLKLDAWDGPIPYFYYFMSTRNLEKHKNIQDILEGQNFKLKNTIRECVVYDDNPDLDIYMLQCFSCSLKEMKWLKSIC